MNAWDEKAALERAAAEAMDRACESGISDAEKIRLVQQAGRLSQEAERLGNDPSRLDGGRLKNL